MILAVDIGNTNISVAGFAEDYEPVFIKKYPDNRFHTADELFCVLERDIEELVSGAVLCSVVPVLAEMAETALKRLVAGEVAVIDSSFNDGMTIKGYDRRKLGNDRIADMTAAKTLYGSPCVVFDMGTATTVSVIDREGAFTGGMIMPGLGLSINALSSGTALLPGIKPYAPNSLLGQDTVSCINNGVIYSQASFIEGTVSRLQEIYNEVFTVVITGGAAKFVLPVLRLNAVYDENLLIKGLRILYDKK